MPSTLKVVVLMWMDGAPGAAFEGAMMGYGLKEKGNSKNLFQALQRPGPG
jgi:hypothetical protein